MAEAPTSTTPSALPSSSGSASEEVLASPPSDPNDDFWLEQGAKMLTESVSSVRTAASSVMTALAAMQSVWLGILGFAKIIPEDWVVWKKAVFVLPFVFWMPAFYCCVQVMLTKLLEINLHSPSDICAQTTQLLREKQAQLQRAVVCLFCGITVAFMLLLIRLKM